MPKTTRTYKHRNTRTRTPTKKQAEVIKIATTHKDLTLREIGTLADCSHVSVMRTLQRYNIDYNAMTEYKSNRADILSGLQHKMLVSITDDDIKKAPLGTRVLAAAQLFDKERLERGKSTVNQATFHADIAYLKGLDDD